MAAFLVQTSDSAMLDLDEIVAYCCETLKAPRAAKGLLDDFDALVDELEQTPEIYPFVRDEKLAALGYKWAPLGRSHAVFYSFARAESTVSIERVLYHPRQWQILLES